ncbi:MAG: hypothetical protein R6V32_08495, partial [Bacteroidales bacterium]
MRTLECDKFASYLKTHTKQDITLIGACTVTKDVESFVIDAINSTNKTHKNIIVCGCISDNIRKVAEKSGATEIISTTELHEMFTQGDQMFPEIQKAKPH